MASVAHHRFTYAEYAQLVEDKGVKLEFLDGQVWAMSGGTPDHARITTNIATMLSTALRDRPCAVYSPDLRVRSKVTGLGTYADVTVICGEVELDADDPKRHTALNPRVLVEVLSPSTEEYDRGAKLDHYKTIASLSEILLVAHDKREVEIFRREEDGTWSQRTVSEPANAHVVTLDVELPLAETRSTGTPCGRGDREARLTPRGACLLGAGAGGGSSFARLAGLRVAATSDG
jgi:Uma2 family endonuclease